VNERSRWGRPPYPRPSRLALGIGRLRPALPPIVIGAGLALVPYPTCLLRLALHVPCPACGLTRAVLAAARLDLLGAERLHPLSLPLLAAFAATVALAFLAGDAAWKRAVPVVTGVAGVALLVVWVLRFAGLFGGPVPV
jgi:Protein of unknown function (DUF2752)